MNNIRFSYLQFIVLAATILLVIWFYQTYTIDIQQHDRSVDTLLKLKQEEKRLDRDTLQIISLQLIQYDPLVKTTANIRSLIELLNSQKTGLYGQINTDIDQKLLAYESALEEKTAILERIKTQAALVRNSLHYLPIAVSELQFESKDRITGLLSNQLHYNIFPSETEEQHLRRELESINDLKTTPEIRSMLDNVRLHMLANLRDRKQLNSLKDSYISVPTVQRFDELYTAYASNYTSQIQTAEHFGWGLLVITIVLFTNLWLAMRRLSTAQRVAQRAWAQLDDAMESLSEAFALFDAQGRLVLRNSKFAEFYPWLRDELVPGATLSLLEQRSKELGFFQPPEKPGNTGPYFSMNITDAKGSSYLQRLADGRRYKASDSKTSEGGMACVRVNITDHLQTEEDLRKLSRAVEQSPATVVITDAEGTIEYANPKFEDTTGFKLDEVIGQNPRILKSGTKKQKDYKEMWDTIQSGHVWHGEFQNRRKDGSMYHEAASISPVRDYNGVITHFIAVKEDITERKQTELELQNYREHLEDEVAKRTEQLAHAKKVAEVATQAKSYFLANMSHEIRTPMNTIIGMSHLALLSNLDSKQRNYIEKVHLSAENLLGILNDILDFSKIEAGKMEMEVTSFQLKEVIDHTLNLIKLKAGEKKHSAFSLN